MKLQFLGMKMSLSEKVSQQRNQYTQLWQNLSLFYINHTPVACMNTKADSLTRLSALCNVLPGVHQGLFEVKREHVLRRMCMILFPPICAVTLKHK